MIGLIVIVSQVAVSVSEVPAVDKTYDVFTCPFYESYCVIVSLIPRKKPVDVD